ncbi:MAG TPA: formate dehydrogenase accessory sulfurtransferase FdhD [Steroidobacteraceae bacterium]|nr:formate dehydrogenase accessory sulfurtransferase FdhD [Steroidobacteraceae bacterium]
MSRTMADRPTAAAPPVVSVTIDRWRAGHLEHAHDEVADERPVQFRYKGVAHVVMLATPADLEDLAVGFTLSEAIVNAPDEIRSVALKTDGEALEVDLDIAPERFAALLQRHRNLTGRTGCGMCGAETLADAIREPPAIGAGLVVSSAELQAALAALAPRQVLNARTGSIHAAAWVVPGAGVTLLREDVGRHNALDKLIGALVRRAEDLKRGYVIVTSRASYEIVQKAATVGIQAVVAVSAPTAFAIRSAEAFGLTLVGFARPDRHVIYAHGERLRP